MKTIIINETNRAKIEAAILECQGKARERLIRISDIYESCTRIEDKFGIFRTRAEGLMYDVDIHAQTFANAYKYIPMSTHFIIGIEKGKWRLYDVKRDITRAKCCKALAFPEAAKDALIARFEVF